MPPWCKIQKGCIYAMKFKIDAPFFRGGGGIKRSSLEADLEIRTMFCTTDYTHLLNTSVTCSGQPFMD